MKKMNKKGFTLVELLGVIVILILILSLVLPKIIGRTKSKNEVVTTLKDDIVIKAAKLYLSENISDPENGETYCVDIDNLVRKEYMLQDSSYDGKYVTATYNDGYSYSISSVCSEVVTSESRCTSNECKACYISKTYNGGVYQYEGIVLESNDENIDLSTLEGLIVYTDDYGCKEQAIKLAAKEYVESNRNDYPADDGNTYCIALNNPLHQQGYITSPIINNSNVNIINSYVAKITYDDNSENITIVNSNNCTKKRWADPILYNRFVPVKYIKSASNSSYDNYTKYHYNYEKYGGCSNSTSYSTGYWVVADPNDKWYDYSEYWWPNAVLLKDGVNKNIGDAVSIEEMVGMFVWIPRYEYKITGGYDDLISVNLILKKNYTTTSGYKISPAFTFGTTQLKGFWIGKFIATNIYTSSNINGYNVRSVPNANLIATASNSTQEKDQIVDLYNFSTNYNLNRNMYDSHNMKLSEYAAALYLSQSQYGKYGNYNNSGGNSSSIHIYGNEYAQTGNSNGKYSAVYGHDREISKYLYDDDHTKIVTCEQVGQTTSPSISTSMNGWSNSSGTYSTSFTGKDPYSSSISFTFTINQDSTVSFTYKKSSLLNCSLNFSIKNSSGTTFDSGSLSSTSDTNYSKVLSSGTYTVTFDFSKSSTLTSATRSATIKNFKVVSGGWSDVVKTDYTNGIGASSTGNIYGVYDMARANLFSLIAYNSNNSKATVLTKYGLTNFDEKYYDTIYVTSNSISCNGSSSTCDGLGLYTEVPASFYDDCRYAQSRTAFTTTSSSTFIFNVPSQELGDISPYCFYKYNSRAYLGVRLVLSYND